MPRIKQKPHAAHASPIRKDQYGFLKYQIEINDLKGDLFNTDTTLNTSSIKYPIFWHEYTHYIQNVATTIGVRIFLNWIGVLVQFGENVVKAPILQIPMNRSRLYNFGACLSDFESQCNKIMGLKEPIDFSPPATAHPFMTYIDPFNGKKAFLCMEEDGTKFGIPLSGNIFVESMAQAVTWMVKGEGLWSDKFLDGKSIRGPNAYYFALFKYFRHITPQLNPCIPVMCVSETALQTLQPAVWFCYLEKNAFAKALTVKWWQAFANNAHQCTPLKQGLQNTLDWLNEFEVANEAKKDTQFMQLALSMASHMKINLTNRLNGISLLPELILPTPLTFVDLCNKCKCPPIYTESIENGFMFNETEQMRKWAGLNLAFVDLVYGLNFDVLKTACPLLHTRICRLRKNKKTYCYRHRLQFPPKAKTCCPMGYAAQLLSVWNKPTVTIR